MTPREFELLELLFHCAKLHAEGHRESEWATPHHIGGSSNSHHSVTLRRMVAKRWVRTRDRNDTCSRPHKLYAITDKGRISMGNYILTKSMEGKLSGDSSGAV